MTGCSVATPNNTWKTGRIAYIAPAARPCRDDPTATMPEFLHGDLWIMLGKMPRSRHDIVIPLHRRTRYKAIMPQITE
jgi:hypothetical protein